MYKELVVSIIILVLIFSLNFISEKYEKDVINELSEQIISLRDEIKEYSNDKEEKNEIDDNKANEYENKIEEIYEKWKKKTKILSIYIEHDEIEKITSSIVISKGNIEVKNYEQSIPEMDNTVFTLNHLREKFKFNIRNLF